MLKIITEISFIILLSWSINQIWDMPGEFIKLWKEIGIKKTHLAATRKGQ